MCNIITYIHYCCYYTYFILFVTFAITINCEILLAKYDKQ